MKRVQGFEGSRGQVEKLRKYTTEMLAEYALGLQAESLPAETVETVRRCVLDLVGAAVAGASSEAAAIARNAAARLGGAGRSDSWFGGGRRRRLRVGERRVVAGGDRWSCDFSRKHRSGTAGRRTTGSCEG